MPSYRILGCSHAMVSMLLDAIHALHGEGIEVELVHNIEPREARDPLPYASDAVAVTERRAADLDAASLALGRNLMGVYRPEIKQQVLEFFRTRFGVRRETYASLVHPGASIAHSASLGPGVTVGPGAVIGPFASLEALVTVNRAASVGHHTRVGALATLDPGCNVAGRCRIGAQATIGMGANVVDGIAIGERSMVGAGAVVTRDVPERVVAYGVPARVIRPRAETPGEGPGGSPS